MNERQRANTDLERAGGCVAVFMASDRFIGELSYGGGAVNQVNIHLFIESMPFGGTGAAGIGHYYGKYGFDMLTHAKSMLIAPPNVAIDHLFPPYTKEKNEALTLWFEY
jgi:aldehyde dehydrogenase (NAD+)